MAFELTTTQIGCTMCQLFIFARDADVTNNELLLPRIIVQNWSWLRLQTVQEIINCSFIYKVGFGSRLAFSPPVRQSPASISPTAAAREWSTNPAAGGFTSRIKLSIYSMRSAGIIVSLCVRGVSETSTAVHPALRRCGPGGKGGLKEGWGWPGELAAISTSSFKSLLDRFSKSSLGLPSPETSWSPVHDYRQLPPHSSLRYASRLDTLCRPLTLILETRTWLFPCQIRHLYPVSMFTCGWTEMLNDNALYYWR